MELQSGIREGIGAKRTIPRAALAGHLPQRGRGAYPQCAALELGFGFGGIRVPKPNSTFSLRNGLDSRGCSCGTLQPNVRQPGGAKARGLGGAWVRVGRGKHSPTPYFCLLVGIQRAMATTSPRGASGFSHSCFERCCAGRTLPPCSVKTWPTLARQPRLRRAVPPRSRPGPRTPSPDAGGHLLGRAAEQPRAPSLAPPRLLPLAAPSAPRVARLPRQLLLARLEPQPGAARLVLPASAWRSPELRGCAAARGGGAGESHRSLRTLSKYLSNE